MAFEDTRAGRLPDHDHFSFVFGNSSALRLAGARLPKSLLTGSLS